MRIHLEMLFYVEVYAEWEWFLLASRCFSCGATMIFDGSPTEFIAVTNRSHNILKPNPGKLKFSSLI